MESEAAGVLPRVPASAVQRVGVSHRRFTRLIEGVVEGVVKITALSAIVVIFLILIFVGREALPLLWQHPEPGLEQEVVTWSKLVGPTEYPDRPARFIWQPVSTVPKYNLLPLVIGTLKTTIIAILFAGPLAILAAILSSEFAPRWLRELIKPTIELLAGIPSVVLGFFALIVLASWLQGLLGLRIRLNALNAGLALGANRWETAIKVVVPAAIPGIFAGVVLGFGRAVGETMVVLMASGNAATTTWAFTDSVRTLSATIAAELGEVVFGSPHYRVLFLIGVLLFVFTFAVNLCGEIYVQRLKERLEGSRT